MMVKDKEPPKRRGLHSAAKIEQLITSHKEKAQWNTPPTPPPPHSPTHNAYCATPLLAVVATHAHTLISRLSSSRNWDDLFFFFRRRRIKLQFIFSPQPQFTSSTLHDSCRSASQKGIGFQCDGFIRAVSRWKNYRCLLLLLLLHWVSAAPSSLRCCNGQKLGRNTVSPPCQVIFADFGNTNLRAH